MPPSHPASSPGCSWGSPVASVASRSSPPSTRSAVAPSARVRNCPDGSNLASERAAVDLAVPFSPRISTPPIRGEMASSVSASRSCDWPTIAVNGNNCESMPASSGAGGGVRSRRVRCSAGGPALCPRLWGASLGRMGSRTVSRGIRRETMMMPMCCRCMPA